MEVLKLPRNEESKIEEMEFSTISPVGIKLHAYLEHKVITTLDDLDMFKERNPIHGDYVDDVIIEMVDKKIIEILDGNIKLLRPCIWEGAQGSDEYKEKTIRSTSELCRQISKQALTDRKSGVSDNSLDFSMIVHFADDPEVLEEARKIVKQCANALNILAATSSKNDKNERVRAVSFSGSVLSEEGL